ncbi:hypothetical protein S83_055164, partial [Arachis hypogaea]
TACDIRTLGRSIRGALAMRLKEGDRMATVDIIPAALWNDMENSSKILGSNGYGKWVPLSRFWIPHQVGLIGYKFAAEDSLAMVFVVRFTLAENNETDLLPNDTSVPVLELRRGRNEILYSALYNIGILSSEFLRNIDFSLALVRK